MNPNTFCVSYILVVGLLCVSDASYEVFSVIKETQEAPFNFKYKWDDFLLMEITLKNIPPSVTTIYAVYSTKYNFYEKEAKTQSEKIEAEIKNGEVKFSIQRSMKENNILVDVELQTRHSLCRTSRIAEGRCTRNAYTYIKSRIIYWHTDWNYDDTGSCVVPKRCEIVMDFRNRCQDNFICYVEEKKYTCKLQRENQENLKSYLYQIYDTDEPRTKVTPRDDYKYLEAVGSFYKIHKTPRTWYDAKRVCDKEGAILFYPKNRAEAEAVISFRNPGPDDFLWVGISDITTEGKFETVDGRPISEVHNKWKPNQPDNYKSKENCVHMYDDTRYNDVECDAKWFSFICKRSGQFNLSSVIGGPLNSSVMDTNLIMDLELFDNNTSVYLATPKSEKPQRSDKIILRAEDVVQENIVRTLTYSETTELEFSCEEHTNLARPKYLFVALINKTKEKIHTLNETEKIRRKFKMADSGSILCCLYYVYESKDNGKQLKISRFVEDKTLIIYNPEAPTMSPNSGGMQDSTESNDSSLLLYLLPTFLGACALTLTLYVLLKRRWFKNSQPAEGRVELDTNAPQSQVLYASLDFAGNRNQPQTQKEESHYAEIVGVLGTVHM